MLSLRTVFLFTFFLAVLVYIAGCASDPEPRYQQPEPMSLPGEVTLDFEALPEGPDGTGANSLDQVLLLVADASAMNFTYSKEVQAELSEARVELEGVKKMRRPALEEFLVELLAAHGFELKDVGPASLRVWQVATSPAAAGSSTAEDPA